MIKRNDKILQKEIIIGFIIVLILTVLSIKANPVNTANDIQIGNIGNYEKDIIDKLRTVFGH